MPTAISPLPDLPTLTRGLTAVLRRCGSIGGPLAVVDRQLVDQGTFPKEVVTCRRRGGPELRLFCKYGGGHPEHHSHGHRGGVAYEAAVYCRVLKPARATAPRYYGTYTRKSAGETWLVLGYMDGSLRVTRTHEPGAMGLAAEWIGRFHARHERSLPGAARSLLRAYDADYYRGWARRTTSRTENAVACGASRSAAFAASSRAREGGDHGSSDSSSTRATCGSGKSRWNARVAA